MAAALAGLFFYSSCSPTEKAETKDYTRYVNTFIEIGRATRLNSSHRHTSRMPSSA